jgi:hypothetical protein
METQAVSLSSTHATIPLPSPPPPPPPLSRVPHFSATSQKYNFLNWYCFLHYFVPLSPPSLLWSIPISLCAHKFVSPQKHTL